MTNKIEIDWDKLRNGISVLEEEENRMNEIFEEIRVETKKVPEYWQGRVSEKTIQELEDFIKNFDDVSSTCRKQISFLKQVADKYQKMDESIDNAINLGSIAKKNS